MTDSTTIRPLTPREQDCVQALVCFHQEFGLFATVTTDALATLTGEMFAGSLGLLVSLGLVDRVSGEDGISYRLSEAGWARFAGVEVQA